MTKRKSETSDAVRGILGGSKGHAAPQSGGAAAEASADTPGVQRGSQRQLTIYLDLETAEALARRAEAEDRPMAYIARQVLRESLL